MKIKTSLVITAGCFFIFLFLMLPVFLSMKEKKEQTIKSFKGSSFSLKDVNNKNITEKSFEGPLLQYFLVLLIVQIYVQ